MAVSTENLIRIAIAGGSLVVDSSISTENLIRIAIAVGSKGVGTLTITGKLKSTENMVRIAIAGQGRVTFDVTSG